VISNTSTILEMGRPAQYIGVYLVSTLILCILIYLYNTYNTYEGFSDPGINKTIWLLWLQGWDSAPWLALQCKTSWEIQNPGWTVTTLSKDNLNQYLSDTEFLHKDTITPQAKSDIIRLNLLNTHGGVWADATALCMQPLDSWVQDDIKPSSFWMYHGTGAGMDKENGPASWFIISVKNSYIIQKWTEACNSYWNGKSYTNNYFWMDSLFKTLYETDPQFNSEWNKVPYIFCEDTGQSHMFANGSWKENSPQLKELLASKPPRMIKLWHGRWNDTFPNPNSDDCKQSNGFYAITLATTPNTG